MNTNPNQLAHAARFIEARDWRDTDKGWTHPDNPDEYYQLEEAYRYEIGLVMLSIPDVTKG